MSQKAGATRIGIFGGTFDPPHVGHLLVAGDAVEQLGLDIVLWVPAAAQPLKEGRAVAPATTRRRMVELTIAGDARFSVEPMELERAGLSFTVDTLADLRERHPRAELFLLIGEDSWRTFAAWREPHRIRELATVVVLVREANVESTTLAGGATNAAGGAPLRLETRRIDISATEVRDRARAGLPIRGFVVDAVERYIAEHQLYQ